MQVQSFEPPKLMPLVVVIIHKVAGVSIWKQRLLKGFELIACCDESSQVHTFGPRAICIVRVVHLDDFIWNLLETHRRDIEAASRACRANPALHDLTPGILEPVLSERIFVKAEIE